MGQLHISLHAYKTSDSAVTLSLRLDDEDAADDLMATIADALEEHAPGQVAVCAEWHEENEEQSA